MLRRLVKVGVAGEIGGVVIFANGFIPPQDDAFPYPVQKVPPPKLDFRIG